MIQQSHTVPVSSSVSSIVGGSVVHLKCKSQFLCSWFWCCAHSLFFHASHLKGIANSAAKTNAIGHSSFLSGCTFHQRLLFRWGCGPILWIPILWKVRSLHKHQLHTDNCHLFPLITACCLFEHTCPWTQPQIQPAVNAQRHAPHRHTGAQTHRHTQPQSCTCKHACAHAACTTHMCTCMAMVQNQCLQLLFLPSPGT